MVNKYASASDITDLKQKWREQRKRIEKLQEGSKPDDYAKYLIMKYDYEHGSLPNWKLEEFFELRKKHEKKN